MSARPHFAYVMYWGALEPVGQATAVPTVLGLAQEARMTLVSFEKQEDRRDREMVARTTQRLEEAGVRWIDLDYTPGYAAVPLDAFRGVRALRRVHAQEPLDAVEGRTFVGGMIGAAAARWLSLPFLYHTEGCWLDEQIDTGRLSPSSPLLRVLRSVESWTVRTADAFVVLTGAGEERLRARYPVEPRAPVFRVPTTSVLVEEAPDAGEAPPIGPGEAVEAVYAGSVTGRYLLEEMLALFARLRARRPGSTLRLLAHRDRERVADAVARHGLEEAVEVDTVPHDRVADELSGRDLGLFFLEGGVSEACVSPTKIAEYLGLGVPVLTTRASGDGAGLVESARAGVVLEDPASPEAREEALDALDALLRDPERRRRAQGAARRHYSLEDAVGLQRDALLDMASRAGRGVAP